MNDERDPLVSQRYRELGAEEPSAELDRAIVGAARRATSRRRWYPSLAAAAVLVFAVAVALHIEREPPPVEPAATVEAPPASEPQSQSQAQPQARAERKVAPGPRRESRPQFTPEPPPSANTNMQAPPSAGAAADVLRSRQDHERYAADAAAPAAPSTAAPMVAKARIAETPEQWLERIARLREQGNSDAADKELARFRERYPDYRIPEAMAKRVAPPPAR